MPLAVIVGVLVFVVVALVGAAGYLIEKNASANEPEGADRRESR
jgi:hypothetical protein